MKIQPYLNKLQTSTKYKEFSQKHKDAFLVAGFFVIDYETGRNIHQIDYYVPSQRKFAAFTLDKSIELQLLNTMDHKIPQEMNERPTTDLDALQGIITDEMKNRSITQQIKKMIAIIQNVKGKNVWNVNCVLSGMDILRVHVEDSSRTVLKMEKSSLLDYIKKLPMPQGEGEQAQAQPGAVSVQSQQVQPQQMQVKQPMPVPVKEDIERKIQQLDKIKELLKKEKIELEKQDAIKKEKSSAVKSKPKKAKK
jgi:hypothetical protein